MKTVLPVSLWQTVVSALLRLPGTMLSEFGDSYIRDVMLENYQMPLLSPLLRMAQKFCHLS